MHIRHSSPLLLSSSFHVFSIKIGCIGSTILRGSRALDCFGSAHGRRFTANAQQLLLRQIGFGSRIARRCFEDAENFVEEHRMFAGIYRQQQWKVFVYDQPSPEQQQMDWRPKIAREYCRDDMNGRICKPGNGFLTEIHREQMGRNRGLNRRSCSKYENVRLQGNHHQMAKRFSCTTRRLKIEDVNGNKLCLGIRIRNLHSVCELEEEICKLEINGSLKKKVQQVERNLTTVRSCKDKNGNLSGNEQPTARRSRMRNHQLIERSSAAMEICSDDDHFIDGSKQYDSISTRNSSNTHSDTHKPRRRLKHPWKEWNDFLVMLQQKDYLKEFLPNEDSLNNGDYLQLLSSSQMKRALLLFSQMEDEIIRYLPREHIKVLVSSGCPSTDKKIVNACKRLRLLCDIREEEACKQCKMRDSCLRAFSESPDSDVQTIDLVRVLQSFAVNATKMKELPSIANSACKVLEEIVCFCNGNKHHEDGTKSLFFPVKQYTSCGNRESSKNSLMRKPGDWTCPDCKFLNYDKARECRQCGTLKDCRKQHEPEDWECPECTFVNFRKNKKCLECWSRRPHGNDLPDMHNIKPGDWRCSRCNFVNFQRNEECYRCSMRKPVEFQTYGVEEPEPGDWKCVKYIHWPLCLHKYLLEKTLEYSHGFLLSQSSNAVGPCNCRNFGREECYKCGAICPICPNKRDVNNLCIEFNGWGSQRRKPCNDGENRDKVDDENDELELDADIIIG